jgi:hypothetical protein
MISCTPTRIRFARFWLPVLWLAAAADWGAAAPAQPAGRPEPARWYKGNLHTHSLWSDGDDYPEMIADWYKKQGYHFLAISDHNVLQQGARWYELKTPVSVGGTVNHRGSGPVLDKYLNRFGPDWVELRDEPEKRMVRLKPLDEYRSLLEEPGRFLMIPGEEISATWKRAKTATTPERSGPVHINVTNLRELLKPVENPDPVVIMQQTLDAVRAQRERTGQPMIAHINHPNFRWGLTAEELMQVKGELFFEIYNGHPGVENAGDATRLSLDAMWDAILTQRLTELKLGVMFGIGVDDSHNYHAIGLGKSNPGRGWIMVRAKHLTAESIVRALEAGDFYATSGVGLKDVNRAGDRLSVAIDAESGVTYRTQFIGTRKGYMKGSREMLPPASEKEPRRTLPHRKYSPEVGAVLLEVAGTNASYTLRGDEIYVRAKIISSKSKVNGSVAGEYETAWTQPLVNPKK